MEDLQRELRKHQIRLSDLSYAWLDVALHSQRARTRMMAAEEIAEWIAAWFGDRKRTDAKTDD